MLAVRLLQLFSIESTRTKILQLLWEMADEIEHHLLGAAHHECVSHVDDARASARHDAVYARW